MSSCPKCGCSALNAYILLDRSWSMSERWSEALGSINAYVAELAKGSAKVTLATFDATSKFQFDLIRDAVPAGDWKDVTDEDATPRGGTPLLDAIGRIVAMAETAKNDKTVIVVMTDGQENQSREVTKETAKAALDRCKAKNWEVIFMGADFNAFGEAGAVGVGASKVINMTAGNYFAATRNLASKSMLYASAGAEVSFDDKDRAEAVGATSASASGELPT